MNMRYLLPLALLFAAPACGEDDPPPPPKSGAPGAKPGAKGGGKPAPQISPRVRVEDRVLDPDEKKGIRHSFKERDFAVDQNNRDPFQSYVLNQGLVGPANDTKPLDVTKKCLRADQMVSSNFSYTDLRLVGIVAQGTQRKVLMIDPSNVGQIIKRGDCVGREKAVVKDIGTGYITFQVEPDENGSTGVARSGEERSVQLYPNQMPITSQPALDNEAAKAQTPDVAPPTTAPRATPPAPEKSQTPPPASPTK
jgi:Tfp pilus assembly protein PilP